MELETRYDLYRNTTALMQLIESIMLGLTELAHKHNNFFVIDSDNQSYSYSHIFAHKFKHRYLNFGNLNSSAIGLIAGIATNKTKVIFINYSRRILPRHYELIRQLINNNQLDVHFIGLESHDAPILNQELLPTTDLNLATNLSQLDVYAPANQTDALLICKAIINSRLPSYTQICLHPFPHQVLQHRSDNLAPQLILSGNDISIASYGIYTSYCLEVAEKLNQQGKSVQLIHIPQINKHDNKLIEQSAKSCEQNYTILTGAKSPLKLPSSYNSIRFKTDYYLPQNQTNIVEDILAQIN